MADPNAKGRCRTSSAPPGVPCRFSPTRGRLRCMVPPVSLPSATRRAASARRPPRSTSGPPWPSGPAGAAGRLRPAGRAVGRPWRPAARLEATVYNLLMERGHRRRRPDQDAVHGMDLLPSNIDLSGAEVQLVHEVGREYVLGGSAGADDRGLRLHPDRLPAVPGAAHDQCAGVRAGGDHPAGMRVFRAARGRTADGDDRQGFARLNPKLAIEGILATMYDSRTLHTREVLTRSSRPSATRSFTPSSTAPCGSQTLPWPGSRSPGSTLASTGAGSYRELAKEVLERWRQAERRGHVTPGKPSGHSGAASSRYARSGRGRAPSGKRPGAAHA